MTENNRVRPHIERWLVKLKGASFELEELRAAFSFPFATIIDRDGNYFLESVALSAFQNLSEVLNEARKLVEIVNGAAKLYFDHYGGVEVANSIIGLDEHGGSHPFSFGFGTGRPVNESHGDTAAVGRWLARAEHEEHVADALRFFAVQSWVDLYKVYELIRGDAGDVVRRGWATKTELSQFTQTTQNRDSIGDAARHASKRFKAHAAPMSLSEARDLVKSLLLHWLEDSGRTRLGK
jgi:hypothetical protein